MIKRRSWTVEEFVAHLRKEAEGIPQLTVVFHGCGSDTLKGFYSRLLPCLNHDDAIWFIPAQATRQTVPPEFRNAVILDLSRDTDRRVYRNLIGDLVFFNASDEAEIAEIESWKGRARAIVVDSSGARADAALFVSCRSLSMTYAWSEATLDEYAEA